jgi:hypothetical protein
MTVYDSHDYVGDIVDLLIAEWDDNVVAKPLIPKLTSLKAEEKCLQANIANYSGRLLVYQTSELDNGVDIGYFEKEKEIFMAIKIETMYDIFKLKGEVFRILQENRKHLNQYIELISLLRGIDSSEQRTYNYYSKTFEFTLKKHNIVLESS